MRRRSNLRAFAGKFARLATHEILHHVICHTHILLIKDVVLPPDSVFVLLRVKRKNDVLEELRIDALGELGKLVLVRRATSGVVYNGVTVSAQEVFVHVGA